MTHRIEFKPSAAKALEDLPRADQRRVLAKIEALAETPRPAGCKKLEGLADLYRITVRVYRVLYQVHDDMLLVLVVRIGHRREVYR